MSVMLIEYPACSTCKKAKAWLKDNAVEFIDRDIVTDTPIASELAYWQSMSGVPVRRLFNTSGKRYRELHLKERLDAGMAKEEAFDLLASDGMLIRRPILIGKDFMLVGFKEEEWRRAVFPMTGYSDNAASRPRP